MEQKAVKKIKKSIHRSQLIIFSSGTVLFVLGLLRYILVPGRWGTNIKTQFPTIVSGAEFMILGALLLLSGFWTMRNKEKVVRMKLDQIKERKDTAKLRYNWGRKRK
ncbi:MAG TPA: hypothetical protein VD927_13195 [Chryseosolibacter sp.]|nr:hypothetical protein [Chryseosolibacter sp.]